MESVLFAAKKKSDLKLLLELAKKMGVKSMPLSKSEVEDWALARSIKSGLETPFVSRDRVLKALRRR